MAEDTIRLISNDSAQKVHSSESAAQSAFSIAVEPDARINVITRQAVEEGAVELTARKSTIPLT